MGVEDITSITAENLYRKNMKRISIERLLIFFFYLVAIRIALVE